MSVYFLTSTVVQRLIYSAWATRDRREELLERVGWGKPTDPPAIPRCCMMNISGIQHDPHRPYTSPRHSTCLHPLLPSPSRWGRTFGWS